MHEPQSPHPAESRARGDLAAEERAEWRIALFLLAVWQFAFGLAAGYALWH